MLVVTTESVPGYRVVAVVGQVFGVTARTHNPYNEGVSALRGGLAPKQISRHLAHWRDEAIAEMIAAAPAQGANAGVGMRFDNPGVSSRWDDICVAGTAVRVQEKTAHGR